MLEYCYFQPGDGGFDHIRVPSERAPDFTLVWKGVVSPDEEFPLEVIWAEHNADDRPRSQEIRSMSVGDMIRLETQDGSFSWWEAAPVGWRQVDPPRVTEGVTLKRFRFVPLEECRVTESP